MKKRFQCQTNGERKPARRRKRVQSKSGADRGIKSCYNIPKTIYQKALDELSEEPPVYTTKIRRRCHQNIYNRFNTSEPADCNANFLEAAKQALEDRNFRALYDILSKAMDIRDTLLIQQMHEYMEVAISLDPKIEKREEVMSDFVSRVKLLDVDPDQYLSQVHTLSNSSQSE